MDCSSQSFINSTCASQSIGAANQLFLGLIQALVTAQCSISPPSLWPKDYASQALKRGVEEYDFVVVGSGSAGAIVAGRLAEVKDWKVLLLEAGGDPPIESELPGMALTMLQTPVDWQFYTEPTENACKGTKTGKCFYPRGKMLGGSSAINLMMYVRGNPHIYDKWAEEGNTGWDYNNVLTYFKKYEGNTKETLLEGENKLYHNGNGPVKISYDRPLNAGDQLIIGAANELGIPYVDDINGKQYSGMTLLQSNAYQGRRESTAKAYLTNITENLHVIKNAMVDKFILNDKNEVESVEFVVNKKHKLSARVKKEAILSAGTIMSPGVLMRSGIGPKDQLKKHHIENKVELPVGENLIDHTVTVGFFKIPSSDAAVPSPFDSIYDLTIYNSGLLTSIGFLAAFSNTQNTTSDPDNESIYFLIPKGSSATIQQFLSFVDGSDNIANQLIEINQEFDLAVACIFMITPQSRGRIELDGKSVDQYPKIYTNFLEEEYDRTTLLNAIKKQLELSNTNAFKSVDAEVIQLKFDECNELMGDDYWQCYMKQVTFSGGHQVGTSRMGPCSDSRSVVDAELKVCGVKKLRQIDAGIMPKIPSGNTNAASMMVGEKGADLVKQEYLNN